MLWYNGKTNACQPVEHDELKLQHFQFLKRYGATGSFCFARSDSSSRNTGMWVQRVFFFFPVFVWFLWFSDYFKAVTRAQTNHTFYTMPWALDFPSSTTATERPLVFKCIPAVFFFLVKKLNAHKVSSAQLCRYNEHMLPAGNACTDLFYQTCLPKLGSEEFTSEEKRTGRLCVYPANRKRLIYGGATS